MPEVRLIDANALKKAVGDAFYNLREIAYITDIITRQPTIEAEPVIHCKDCAFWESKRVSREGLAKCRRGESVCRYRFGHDFCSRAQRREKVSSE